MYLALNTIYSYVCFLPFPDWKSVRTMAISVLHGISRDQYSSWHVTDAHLVFAEWVIYCEAFGLDT